MNKSVIENDNKILGKLLCAIQAIIQDSSNTKYIEFLKQQAKLFENIFNKNISKVVNTVSAEIYKSLTNTNLMKEEDFLNDNNNTDNNNNFNNYNKNYYREGPLSQSFNVEAERQNRLQQQRQRDYEKPDYTEPNTDYYYKYTRTSSDVNDYNNRYTYNYRRDFDYIDFNKLSNSQQGENIIKIIQ